MSAECVFCRILAGDIPCFRLHEDEATLAFMDINPANEGHALVIPRAHTPDLFAVAPEDLAAVMRTAQRVALAVRDELGPAGLNLIQCNGPAAAQSVAHFHVHVLPRREGDELKLNWGLRPGNVERIERLAGALRARLG